MFVVRWLLIVVDCCLLGVVCRFMFAVVGCYLLLFMYCLLLLVVRCALCVVFGLLFVGVLLIACCSLFVDDCSLLIVVCGFSSFVGVGVRVFLFGVWWVVGVCYLSFVVCCFVFLVVCCCMRCVVVVGCCSLCIVWYVLPLFVSARCLVFIVCV